ncbi:MAG: RNA polymerase sigma factor [Blautia sp.]
MTEEKLREVYSQYYRLVMKAAYEVLHDFDYCQDICQEVFSILAEKWDIVRPEQYSQWLATVARRKALDFRRKNYQQHEFTLLDGKDEDEEDRAGILAEAGESQGYHSDDTLDRLICREFTKSFMDDLYEKNPEWYDMMSLMVYEEKTDAEIAQELGITIENLRVKKHRMKKWIDQNYGDRYRSL